MAMSLLKTAWKALCGKRARLDHLAHARVKALVMRVLQGQIGNLHEPGAARMPDHCKAAAGMVGARSRNSLQTLLAQMKSLQRGTRA